MAIKQKVKVKSRFSGYGSPISKLGQEFSEKVSAYQEAEKVMWAAKRTLIQSILSIESVAMKAQEDLDADADKERQQLRNLLAVTEEVTNDIPPIPQLPKKLEDMVWAGLREKV